ncbi:MAG: hypothetical protein K2X27_16105 [Candidatus Obscuribacterales bacterium]|nr:hypothetical protein [Candidatus Obscuribacterales bacterium]
MKSEAVEEGSVSVSEGVADFRDNASLSGGIRDAGAAIGSCLNSADINHHKAMIRFGVIGTALGALLGTALVPHIPCREMMFTIIVPIQSSLFGLFLGFFAAGFRKAILREDSQFIEFRQAGSLSLLFEGPGEAERAFSVLSELGVAARQITVIGEDSDDFRAATASLHHRKIDKALLIAAAIGALLGAYWGVICCPQAATPASTLMASVSGSFLGMLIAGIIAAILHLDNSPASDATFIEASVNDAFMAASIIPADSAQREQILKLIEKRDAKESPMTLCEPYEALSDRISA